MQSGFYRLTKLIMHGRVGRKRSESKLKKSSDSYFMLWLIVMTATQNLFQNCFFLGRNRSIKFDLSHFLVITTSDRYN